MPEIQFGDVSETFPKAKRGNRSEQLSVSFPDGYIAGWFMAVPCCFLASLDIEKTPRVRKDAVTGDKREEMIWTEGKPAVYSFSPGDMLYDSRATGRNFGDLIAEISVALQVVGASPDNLRIKGSKTSGWVRISEFRPSSDRSRLENVATHRMTQDEFVALLRTGTLPNGTSLQS